MNNESAQLIDIYDLNNNFISLPGYINTVENEQRKGEKAMKNKPLEPTDFYIKDENEKGRQVWLAVRIGYKGQTYFTFDKQNFYSLFKDYPYKLTDEQIEIFKKGLPYWADFFKSRLKEKDSEDE